jgi:hypothetical protein
MTGELNSDRTFFGRFKNRIKDETGQNPGGRYFSILLEQIFQEDPALFGSALFPNLQKSQLKTARVLPEYRLANKRIADLALINDSNEPIALVEVKEEDQLGAHVDDQTQAYLKYILKARKSKEPIQFAYITKHLPLESTLKRLTEVNLKPIYYRDIHAALKDLLARDQSFGVPHPIAELFCRYLEEDGVTYREIEDEQAIALFLRQASNPKSTPGRLHTADRASNAARILDVLLGNSEVLGIEFHNTFREYFGNRFTPSFQIWNEFDEEAIRKTVHRKGFSIHKHISKGVLSVCSYGKISGVPNWAYVRIGFWFELEGG